MDNAIFELLFRETVFSSELLVDIWDSLTTLERIEVANKLKSMPKRLLSKAINDPNPVVRMLAGRNNTISKDNASDLYEKLLADTSPIVKAGIMSKSFLFDTKTLIPLSHVARLGVIALTDGLPGKSFSEFILGGLKSKLFTETEAGELVIEFVRNPALTRNMLREPIDGMDDHMMGENFKAIWELTVTTPLPVHYFIGWEYPFEAGGFFNRIPRELFESMGEQTLSALIWRNCTNLISYIKNSPEKFSDKIKDELKTHDEEQSKREESELSESATLSKEVREFKDEVRVRLDEIDTHIDTLINRRKGFFG